MPAVRAVGTLESAVRLVRLVIATAAACTLLAVGAIVALAAPGAVTRAAGAAAGNAVYCGAGVKELRQKQLDAFVRTMPAARSKNFATHHKARDRSAFVRTQTSQLNALKRALGQCA